MAIIARAGFRKAGAVRRRAPGHVIADIEVERAVAVEIEEKGRHAPIGVIRARRRSDVLESPVTEPAQQLVASQAGDVEVSFAVGVEIAGGHTHAVAAGAETRFGRDVDESRHATFPLTLVAKKAIAATFASRGSLRAELAALEEKKI